MDPKKTKVILAVVAFIIIAIVLGKVISDGREKIKMDVASTQEVMETKWEYQVVGDIGLAMNVPEKLHEVKTVLDENAKKVLQEYDAYEYTVGSFSIRINHLVANDKLSARDYAERLGQMLETDPNIKGYSYEIEDINQGMASGVFMKGSGMKSDIDTLINTMVLVKGNNLWDITMFVNNSNNDLKILMEETYNSVNIR